MVLLLFKHIWLGNRGKQAVICDVLNWGEKFTALENSIKLMLIIIIGWVCERLLHLTA